MNSADISPFLLEISNFAGNTDIDFINKQKDCFNKLGCNFDDSSKVVYSRSS